VPSPAQAAVETVITELINDNPQLPLEAAFRRGINPHRGPLDDPILRDYVRSPGWDIEWYVSIRPSDLDVCISVAGRRLFGVNDVLDGVARVPLPQSTPGTVDVDALAGSKLHVALLAAIREKANVAAQMRANVHS
jgi:hypothetical protein